MLARKLMCIAWPAFLAACVLQVFVFALVDPLELHALALHLDGSRQAVYAVAFFLFWAAAFFSSALTAWLGGAAAAPGND